MDEATREGAFESHVERGPHGAHETSDVAVISISKFGIVIAGATILSMMLMWFLLDFMKGYEADISPKAPPMAAQNPQKTPPPPNLQGSPIPDLREFRAAEDQKISSYSLVDKDRKLYQIPVERALELTAQSSKLPAWEPAPGKPAAGTPTQAQGGAKQ